MRGGNTIPHSSVIQPKDFHKGAAGFSMYKIDHLSDPDWEYSLI
jgi:hypothetical protein